MHNKIYIIGPVGSGKTTFATNLSKKMLEEKNLNRVEVKQILFII